MIGIAASIGSGTLVGALATEVSAATVTVSGAATNAPNASCVYVETSDGVVVATTTTGANGAFSASVSNGNYVVQIDPSCFGDNTSETEAGAYYDSGAADNATTLLTDATIINATGGSVTGIDLTLTTGATLSGGALENEGGAAPDVCVYLYDSTDSWFYQATTTGGGEYMITGIAPEPTSGYILELDPSCGGTVSSAFAPTFFDNATVEEGATPIPVNGTSSVIALTVPVGGVISGTVTEPNGSAAANVCVYVESTDADESYLYAQETGSSGSYTFSGLAATTFNIYYDPGCDGSQSTDFGGEETSSAISITSGVTSTLNGTLSYSGSSLSISPTTATTGTVGSAFSQGFSTSGGIAPFAWSAANLPAGLSINSSTGIVTGTPTTAGTTTATIVATDSSAQAVAISQSVTFNINPAPVPPTTTSTTTTTTVPYVPPAPTPKVTVGISNIVLKSGTSASIPVSCQAATCSGTVKLVEKTTTKVAYKKRVGKKTVTAYETKTVTTVLGTASFKLKKGKKATETLLLNGTGMQVVGDATAKKQVHEFLETSTKGGKTITKTIVVS